jgi:hypothetical protein
MVPVFGYLSSTEDLRSEPRIVSGQLVLLHTPNDILGHRSEQHFSINDVSYLSFET